MSIKEIQIWSRASTFEYGDLLPEGEDFEGSVAATPDEGADHGEDGEDEFEHELTLVAWRQQGPQWKQQPNATR